jgi:hypothetical protein
VIVLILVIAENDLRVSIQFDGQTTPAARLLRWDLPVLPLGSSGAVLGPMAARPFTGAPQDAPLPPVRRIGMHSITHYELNTLIRLLGSKPRQELPLVGPLRGHLPALTVMRNAPVPACRSRVFDLARVSSECPKRQTIFGNGGADGDIKCRHSGSIGGGVREGGIVPPSHSTRSTFHAFHTTLDALFTRYFILFITYFILFTRTNKE